MNKLYKKEQLIEWISKNSALTLEESLDSRLEEVISRYKEFLEKNPDESQFQDWELWWQLAGILEELGQVPEALAAYQQVIKLNSYWVQAYQNAIKLQPENYELWWQLACNVYAEQGLIEEATEAYQAVVKLNPDFLPAYYCLLELQLENWEIWWKLGKALDKQNQYEQAIVAYNQAIVLNPDFDGDFGNDNDIDDGYIYVQTSGGYSEPTSKTKIESIKSDLKKTYVRLAKQATDLNVYRHLSKTWQRQGHLNKVITFWQKLVKTEPTNVNFNIEMGNILLLLERRNEALNSYYRANQIYLEEVRRNGRTGRLFLITLPKSGGQYLAISLQKGLGINQAPLPGSNNISFDDVLIMPSVHNGLHSSKDIIVVSHAYSNDFNRLAITQYVDKLIVNVRDPRQATLSHIHNLNLIHRQAGKEQLLLSVHLPQKYFLWSLSEQITWQIDQGFFPKAIQFIQGWLEADEDPNFYPPILFTRYEHLVEAPEKYFTRILEFYGFSESSFDFPEQPKFQEKSHYRKGEIDEWKKVFTSEQADKACSMLPEKVNKFLKGSYDVE